MYCKNCGRKIEKDSKFCQLCGAEQASKSYAVSKDSSVPLAEDKNTKNPMLTISGFVSFVVVLIFVYWLLKDQGVIGAMIAGGVAGCVAWAVTSFKMQATRIEKDTKEREEE
ncbi:MAG: zinc-ribbon domain-containing protein [Candidatus Levybacteria bacterium]|nr:zinc-ribbon domain-containing protein [Candidatus Levybacteria bacterium]